VAQDDGTLRPVEGISQCPSARGDAPCCLSKHTWRKRKTGPCFPVRVLLCRTHGGHFTVYPQSFVPYGRERIAPATRGAPEPTASTSAAWAGTVFEAAARAAAGERAVRDAGFEEGPAKPRHSTQRRRVRLAARLLALSPEIDERLSEKVGQCLDLPGLDHRDERAAFARAATLRERGRVILSTLERLPQAGAFEQRLLGAGHLTGLWGPPSTWDARTSRRVFPPCGTPAPIPTPSPPLPPNENLPPPAPGAPATVPVS